MAADRPDGSDGPGAPRVEMDAAPPFATWRTIYAIVLAALAAEIVAGIILSSLMP